MARPYHEQVDMKNTLKLRELTETLPDFVRVFFRGIEQTTSSRTRIAYAYDLHVFFSYLLQKHKDFAGKTLKDIAVTDLDLVKAIDIEDYMDYLKYYHTEDGTRPERVNKERGIIRKVASLKTFYNYFFKKEMIRTNPAALVTLPKLHSHEIVRLEVDEVALMLDSVESGDKLTKKQQAFHKKTEVRDMALISLLLGTGIRVSECVGLNMNDVDFKNAGIHIHRKGGKEVIVYFSDEVALALMDYYREREKILPADGHEDALFLSLQRKRMNVRSVENLVKKYAQTVTTLKNITPHKLRSTYGTNLYKETGDIYLVADVLGHSDVNTTKKHYAALEDDRRRSARNIVKLREEIPGAKDETP